MPQQPSTSNKLAIHEVNYTSLKTVKYIDFSKCFLSLEVLVILVVILVLNF